MKKRFLWVALTATVLLAFAVLSFSVARSIQSIYVPKIPSTPVACDLAQQACVTDVPQFGQISLSISPRPIPLMKSLDFAVSMSDAEVQAQRVDITGINMEMGLNRVRLAQDKQKNVWLGRTVLPICSQRRMQWQAKLVLQKGDQEHAVLYRFSTLKY